MCDATDSSHQWRSWLAEHANRFHLFARQQSRSEADAEDLLQDALVETWTRCVGQVPPPAMVYATIRRRAIDRARQMDARERREQSDWHVQDLWELPEVDERADLEALLAAVLELPADQQEVVYLRTWGGLSFKDIATAVGAPLPTVASRFQAALKRLKSNLIACWS
jgi:RNA polymerase sigma-70 factor (ECF subfamily)